MLDRRTALLLLTGCGAALILPQGAGPASSAPGAANVDRAPMQGGGSGPHQRHVDGRALLAERLRRNGRHALGRAGTLEVAAEVANGKVVALVVKDSAGAELQVGKVRSTKNFAIPAEQVTPGTPFGDASTWHYAYWFKGDAGTDWYYWFAAGDVIVDGSWVIFYA
jgi:hypothetical protein